MRANGLALEVEEGGELLAVGWLARVKESKPSRAHMHIVAEFENALGLAFSTKSIFHTIPCSPTPSSFLSQYNGSENKNVAVVNNHYQKEIPKLTTHNIKINANNSNRTMCEEFGFPKNLLLSSMEMACIAERDTPATDSEGSMSKSNSDKVDISGVEDPLLDTGQIPSEDPTICPYCNKKYHKVCF